MHFYEFLSYSHLFSYLWVLDIFIKFGVYLQRVQCGCW